MNDFYKSCGIPKPVDKKKHKKQNGYKDKHNRRCYYTGILDAERHEVFCGKYRQISIDYGFQVDVHPLIHAALQKNSTEWAVKENRRWKESYQKKYESKLKKEGLSKEDARRMWMDLIGENYTDEVM